MPEGIAVVVRVPNPLAASFPPLKSDFPITAPHVTVAYIGGEQVEAHDAKAGWPMDMNAPPSLVTALADVLTDLASGIEPFKVTISGTHSFEPSESSEGRRVIVSGVQSEGLLALRAKLLERVSQKLGIDASGSHAGYVPHATLAYLKDGETYGGPQPEGVFTAREIEIWHGAQVAHIELGNIAGW